MKRDEDRTILERQRPGETGPWKWQIIRELQRIADALERPLIIQQQREEQITRARSASGKRSAEARHEKYGTAQPYRNIDSQTPENEKKQVRLTLQRAVRHGDILKPDYCSHCLKNGTIHGHHEDYSKPLEVIWLCASCHAQIHSAEPVTPGEFTPGIRPRRGNAAALIATYCDAFKARYGLNPPIDGKTAGLASNLLKTMPLQRAQELVQAYLQVEDKWFMTKCHDFPTFTQSITKVAVSLFHGTQDPHEKNYWAKVFGGSIDGHEGLPAAGNTAQGELGRAQLQSGESEPVLEELSVSDE